MSNVLKKSLAVLGLVGVSVVASATTVHLMTRQASSSSLSWEGEQSPTLSANEYGFQNTALSLGSRPVGNAPDLTPAAESSVKAVVHIKVKKIQQVREQQMIDPFEFFFGGDPRGSRQQ